jgi:ferric-dicitrate binding protein FerR (iron transport regulator)
MNPTRELITDLLPAYFSGEASADTRALVDEFFAEDPEFERMARRLAGSLNALKQSIPDGGDELEKRALVRARTALRGQNLSLGVALAGIVGIVLLVAIEGGMQSATKSVYTFMVLVVVACVAVYALLVNWTRNTGL